MDTLDFGDETSGSDVVTGMAASGGGSRDMSKCQAPSVLGGHPLLYTHIAQRECLVAGVPLTRQNTATVANVEKTREMLRGHLVAAPCLIVHYGTYETDFESLMDFGRAVAAESKDEIPVAFCAANARGKDVIDPKDVPSAILRGVSVFYNISASRDFVTIGDVLSRCAERASTTKPQKLDISPIRLVVVIDRTASYLISQVVRDGNDDKYWLVEGEDSSRFNIANSYLPQVEPVQDVASTLVSKDWETKMKTHVFRTSHFPPSAINSARYPLDQLGFLLAFHPFGASYVVTVALLAEKGMLVRKLYEAWISTTLGTPSRFITSN